METERSFGNLKTNRIEALSDGIFAIAMTILILSFETILHRPESYMNEEDFVKTLIGMWPDFIHYVQSFLILGVFWYQSHRQFHYIKSVDVRLLFPPAKQIMKYFRRGFN